MFSGMAKIDGDTYTDKANWHLSALLRAFYIVQHLLSWQAGQQLVSAGWSDHRPRSLVAGSSLL